MEPWSWESVSSFLVVTYTALPPFQLWVKGWWGCRTVGETREGWFVYSTPPAGMTENTFSKVLKLRWLHFLLKHPNIIFKLEIGLKSLGKGLENQITASGSFLIPYCQTPSLALHEFRLGVENFPFLIFKADSYLNVSCLGSSDINKKFCDFCFL